jgi:hypothetical protein
MPSKPKHTNRHSRKESAGFHPKRRPEGCPINNVGHDNLFASSPRVVSGDPSGNCQDGFPIKAVGNDDDGDGFPITPVGNDKEQRAFFGSNGHNMEVTAHKAISPNFNIVTIAIAL